MVATSSAFKLAGFSSIASIAALCFWAVPASAQSTGGMSGAPSGGMSGGGAANLGGADSSGGAPSGAGGQSGGMSAGGASNGGAASGAAGMSSGGANAAAGMNAGGAPGAAGMSSTGTGGAPAVTPGNLLSNGTFDSTSYAPWWGNASSTDDYPADETLAVTNGALCATMTAGGQNVWDVLIGYSGLVLQPGQYYHISFGVTADAPRTIKFKTGLGTAPYTDYFIESVPVTAVPQTATPQLVDYTYYNLRDDASAQFQFQIGSTPGTVCVDNIVVEQVPAPVTPTYKTPAPSGHPFKDYAEHVVKMGTAVDTPIFLSNPLHNSIVAGEFSMITPANSMKMNLIQPTQGVFDYTDTDALVAWAQQNHLEFHGHPLVWHTQTPSWLTDTTFTRDQMIDIMYAQIDGLMGHYAGKFPYWDVVNEAVDEVNNVWTYRSTVWHDTIGDDFIDLAFQHARQTDPNAILLYNDYNIEQKGNPKADYVYNMVATMKANNIPIDAIGFQGHYFVEPDGTTANGVPDMQAIRDNMARYAAINVEVHVTECDFRIGLPLDPNKTAIQNKFYADLLQVCIDAPNCSHFTVWGLSDLDSWVPSTFPDYDYAHLFDKMLMPKPDYFAMSAVFAQYNPLDGTPIGTMMGVGGMGGMTGAGIAGGTTTGPATGTPSGSSSPKHSSGGCSLAPQPSSDGPWTAAVLALFGLAFFRRRSQAARS